MRRALAICLAVLPLAWPAHGKVDYPPDERPMFGGADPADAQPGEAVLAACRTAAKKADSDVAAACASLDVAAARARAAQDPIAAAILDSAARIASAEAGKPRPPAAGAKPPAARGALRKGAQLIELWADALSGDEASRKRARQQLAQLERSEEGALRLLAIYAQGRSLAAENDPEEVRRGVGRMLLIPAAHADMLPALTDAALMQSAEALTRIRDDASAGILRAARADMQEQFQASRSVETGDTP